jgi:hypothetical protein
MTDHWQPGSLDYEADATVYQSNTAAIELGLKRDGTIDLVLAVDGQDIALSGLTPVELADLGRKLVEAAANPMVTAFARAS